MIGKLKVEVGFGVAVRVVVVLLATLACDAVTVMFAVDDRDLWVVIEEMVDVRSGDEEDDVVPTVGDGFVDVDIDVDIVVDPDRPIV